jgi:hypothetical protein
MILIDAVWSGNFERGEIVSPVAALPVNDRFFNLVTPDARHRPPAQILLYRSSVKSQSAFFHYRSPETARPSFMEVFAKQCFLDFVWLALPFAGMVAFRPFRPSAANRGEVADSNSRKAVSFSSARTRNAFRRRDAHQRCRSFVFH